MNSGCGARDAGVSESRVVFGRFSELGGHTGDQAIPIGVRAFGGELAV